jgi:hypothetical protein
VSELLCLLELLTPIVEWMGTLVIDPSGPMLWFFHRDNAYGPKCINASFSSEKKCDPIIAYGT